MSSLSKSFASILGYSLDVKQHIPAPVDIPAGKTIQASDIKKVYCWLLLLEEERQSIRQIIHNGVNSAINRRMPRFAYLENEEKYVDGLNRNIGIITADSINKAHEMCSWIKDDLNDIISQLTPDNNEVNHTEVLEIVLRKRLKDQHLQFIVPSDISGAASMSLIYKDIWRTHSNRYDSWDHVVMDAKNLILHSGDVVKLEPKCIRIETKWNTDVGEYDNPYWEKTMYALYTVKINNKIYYYKERAIDVSDNAWFGGLVYDYYNRDGYHTPAKECFEPYVLTIQYKTRAPKIIKGQSDYYGPDFTAIQKGDYIKPKDINDIYIWIRKAIALSDKFYNWWDNANLCALAAAPKPNPTPIPPIINIGT